MSQSIPDAQSDWPATHRDSYEVALNHVRISRLSDAELIYTPSQIALAAMSLVFPAECDNWLQTKFPNESLSSIRNVIQTIKGIIQTCSQPPDIEAVRNVDRRLRTCKNPEKVVGSKAYLARQAEEEKKNIEKRARKAEGGIQEEDPFGHELTKIDDDDDDDD